MLLSTVKIIRKKKSRYTFFNVIYAVQRIKCSIEGIKTCSIQAHVRILYVLKWISSVINHIPNQYILGFMFNVQVYIVHDTPLQHVFIFLRGKSLSLTCTTILHTGVFYTARPNINQRWPNAGRSRILLKSLFSIRFGVDTKRYYFKLFNLAFICQDFLFFLTQ